MARKKKIRDLGKLPSGQVRLKVYDYSEPVLDPSGNPVMDEKTGKPKIRKIYHSITADTLEDALILKKDFINNKKSGKPADEMSVGQAMNKYIEISRPTLSPTTIQRYEQIRRYAFQDIMEIPLRRLTPSLIRQSVALECKRPNHVTLKPLAAKTIHDEFGLLTATLNLFYPELHYNVTLPQIVKNQHELSFPDQIFDLVRGTDIELAVLLAMWLSFTMSEIKGLTKSRSLSKDGQYISVVETSVMVHNKAVRKDTAKQPHRRRQLRIPPYIQKLISQVETDELVPYTHRYVSGRFTRMIDDAGLPHMTFHDLRHVNASVMAYLGEDKVPAQYARARGGWSSDHVMRGTYMQQFDRKRQEVDDQIDGFFASVLSLDDERPDADVLFEKLRKLSDKKYTEVMHQLFDARPDLLRDLHRLLLSSRKKQ